LGTIFISHNSRRIREAEIFKRLVREHRNQREEVQDVFLSSDGFSIDSGDLWLCRIFERLEKCARFVALIADAQDFENKWILFEAAFAKGRGLRPAIFVFGQLEMTDCPWPLAALQLIDSGNTDRVQKAMCELGVVWETQAEADFAHLFRQCGCYRNPAEGCKAGNIARDRLTMTDN
jgi:hypothetical protein